MIDSLRLHRIEGVERDQVRRTLADDALWRSRTLLWLRSAAQEVALIATCERVELYVVAPGSRWREAVARMHWGDAQLEGRAAARHLLRVAAGLESRIVGETHILGQVHAAARFARDLNVSGPLLDDLFVAASRSGRRVRSQTELGRLAGSYVTSAVAQLRRARPGPIGIVGSGALAREAILALHAAGCDSPLVFTRHVERAEGALPAGSSIRPLADLRQHLPALAAVLTVTSTARAILTPADVQSVRRPLLIVDLGMPLNVDPRVSEHGAITLVTLDELAGPTHAATILTHADEIVQDELNRLLATQRAAAKEVA